MKEKQGKELDDRDEYPVIDPSHSNSVRGSSCVSSVSHTIAILFHTKHLCALKDFLYHLLTYHHPNSDKEVRAHI